MSAYKSDRVRTDPAAILSRENRVLAMKQRARRAQKLMRLMRLDREYAKKFGDRGKTYVRIDHAYTFFTP